MTRFVVCGETLIDLVQSDAGTNDSFSSTWLALSSGPWVLLTSDAGISALITVLLSGCVAAPLRGGVAPHRLARTR